MLHEEGLEKVFYRHDRRKLQLVLRCMREVLCQEPKDYSSSLTAVLLRMVMMQMLFVKLCSTITYVFREWAIKTLR